MNRRKFIETCACCAFVGTGTALLGNSYINNEKNNVLNSKIERIGIHIAEHCNLNCKYCSHFSCIAEKEFYDPDQFDQDVARLSYLFKKKLDKLHLLGGEPLLNPQIDKYVKISRKYFPNTTIKIITNGILLDDMDEKFWKTLNENNVCIVPTIYPIKINWASILEKAKKYSVDIYQDAVQEEKLTLDNIDKFCRKTFFKMRLSENEFVNIDKSKCLKRYKHNDMYCGHLYPCFFIAYIKHFNKKFGTKFNETEEDYLDIYKIKSIKEINEFRKTPQYPFCKYCSYDHEVVKWESSSVHSINEWT